MKTADHNKFAEAQVREDVHHYYGDMTDSNGAGFADVAMCALAVDVRRSGRRDGWSDLLEMGRPEYVELASNLIWSLEDKDREFELPLGTPVRSVSGGLEIAREAWLLDVARPGLHQMETLDRNARGPNLELLTAEIERLTRKLACRRIGLPQPDFVADADARHLLLFPAFEAAGGVRMQRFTYETGAERFCSASRTQIKAFAADIVKDMRVLWAKRGEIGQRVDQVRQAAVAAGHEVEMITIDLHNQRENTKWAVYPHIKALDEAFRPGRVLCFVDWRDDLERGFPAPMSLDWRKVDLEEYRELGAEGAICEVAAAILQTVPGGPGRVLRRLADAYETTVTVPTEAGPGFITFFWRDGVIKAEMSVPGVFEYFNERLEFITEVNDEATLAAMVGKRLDEIEGLPFACASQVRHADKLIRGLRLTMEPWTRLVSLTEERIWADPRRAA